MRARLRLLWFIPATALIALFLLAGAEEAPLPLPNE